MYICLPILGGVNLNCTQKVVLNDGFIHLFFVMFKGDINLTKPLTPLLENWTKQVWYEELGYA